MALDVDIKVVEEFQVTIKKEFGNITITRGKKHFFLGVTIEITPKKTIKIDMSDQLLEAIEMFGEEISGNVASIATHSMFKVDKNAEKLSKCKQDTSIG